MWSATSQDFVPKPERHYQKGKSGKQNELNSEEERRKSDPIAARRGPRAPRDI